MARTAPRHSAKGGAPAPQRPGKGGSTAVLHCYNRRLTTFRGTQANAYGDETDVGIPYLTEVQAAIAETADTVFDAASQRMQIVRGLACRIPACYDVIDTDTVFDPATGNYYVIDSKKAEPGPGYYPPVNIFQLTDRSGVSIQSD